MAYTHPTIGQDPWGDDLLTGLDQFDARISALAYNVKDPTYGAVGDGLTDDTTAIQNALDAASESGGGVYLPPGSYSVTGLNLYPNVDLYGAGQASTTILCTNPANHALTLTAPGDFPCRNVVRDLSITGTGSGTTSAILVGSTTDGAPCYGFGMSRVFVSGFGGYGFRFDGCFMMKLSHLDAWDNSGGGFWLDGGTVGDTVTGTWQTSITMDTCYANGNGGPGFRINKATYINLISCAADNNTIGYDTKDARDVHFIACGAESPDDPARQLSVGTQPIGFRFDATTNADPTKVVGCSNILLDNCYVYCVTEYAYQFLNQCINVTMNTCSQLTAETIDPLPAGHGLAVGATCTAMELNCAFPDGVTIANGAKNLMLAPATAVGDPAGLQFDPASPKLFPWKDSIQIYSSANADVPLSILGTSGQSGAFLFAHKANSTPTDGGPAITLQPYGQGQVQFGTDQASMIERPTGVDFLSFNKPPRIPVFGSIAAAGTPESDGQLCIISIPTYGPRLCWSDNGVWKSYKAGSDYAQNVTAI